MSDSGFASPYDILIPGEDPEVESHPLSEGKKRLIPDELMAKNIIFNGYIQPVVVKKEGTQLIVVAGRRRVFNGRIASEILLERGEKPRKVPYIIRRDETHRLLGISAAENSIRKDLTLIEKAKKIQQIKDHGGEDDEIACDLGISEAWVQKLVSLLELDERVQDLVEEELISASAALELLYLPLEEQYAKAKELLESGKKPTIKSVRKAARGITSAPTKTKIKTLVSFCGTFEEPPLSQDFLQGVMWAKGLLEDEDVQIDGFVDTLTELKKRPAKK